MSEISKEPFKPFIETIDGRTLLVKNEQGEFEDLEYMQASPTRKRLTETLKYFNSFVDSLATRFDGDMGAVYVRLENLEKFSSFWMEGFAADCRVGPQWRDDVKIKWIPDFTKVARDWIENDEKPMSQEDFALFLDKHLASIVKPDDQAGNMMPSQADLFNFVTTLEDSKGQKFSRKVNVQNGDVSVSLEKVSDDGTTQRLKLFERFAIALQIFEGFPAYQVTAKLRYRVRDGQVIFSYDIEGLEEMFIAARQWAVFEVQEKTGLPVYI